MKLVSQSRSRAILRVESRWRMGNPGEIPIREKCSGESVGVARSEERVRYDRSSRLLIGERIEIRREFVDAEYDRGVDAESRKGLLKSLLV